LFSFLVKYLDAGFPITHRPFCLSFLVCSQQGPLLPFANGRQTSENFKISLKSPNTLKNSTPPSLGGGGAGHPGLGNGSSSAQLNAAALGLGPAVSILSNVTSTNPKTPSPSTHEVGLNIIFKFIRFSNLFLVLIEHQGLHRTH